jgi:hypothetical protein
MIIIQEDLTKPEEAEVSVRVERENRGEDGNQSGRGRHGGKEMETFETRCVRETLGTHLIPRKHKTVSSTDA